MLITCKGDSIILETKKKIINIQVTYFSYVDSYIQYWDSYWNHIIKIRDTDVVIIGTQMKQDGKIYKPKSIAFRGSII